MKFLPVVLAAFLFLPSLALAANDAAEDDVPNWWGDYCNEKLCLNIGDFREGPGGYSFVFAFVQGDKIAGEGTAGVDGRTAGYIDLRFELKDNDNVVVVSPDPDMKPLPEEAWTAECFGTYKRK